MSTVKLDVDLLVVPEQAGGAGAGWWCRSRLVVPDRLVVPEQAGGAGAGWWCRSRLVVSAGMVTMAATWFSSYSRRAAAASTRCRRNTWAASMDWTICPPSGPWSRLTTATGLAPVALEPRKATSVYDTGTSMVATTCHGWRSHTRKSLTQIAHAAMNHVAAGTGWAASGAASCRVPATSCPPRRARAGAAGPW